MSSTDDYIPVRATACTEVGEKVGWMSNVHPDLWEDRPVLDACILSDLKRVAADHGDTLVESTLVVEQLHPLPGFEHLLRNVTDPHPRDSL